MKKVYVIDDDNGILTVVELILQKSNYDVKATTMWEDVVEAINEFNPDLILIDVNLHGADGRELCKKIKEIERWKKVPILLFSARHELNTEYVKCNADGFISKPFDLPTFLATIEHHLASRPI